MEKMKSGSSPSTTAKTQSQRAHKGGQILGEALEFPSSAQQDPKKPSLV